VSVTDYIVDILLFAVIFRLLRARELTAKSVILPLALIVYAGSHYLHHFTLSGNDLTLIVILTTIGIGFGTASGASTSVWRSEHGTILARAGAVAATTWVLGMGFRFGFSIYANSQSGGHTLARFSADHAITSAQAWTTALVLMAFGEVLARVAVLQLRRLQHATAAPTAGQASIEGHGAALSPESTIGLR
jgi:hypothetical protein